MENFNQDIRNTEGIEKITESAKNEKKVSIAFSEEEFKKAEVVAKYFGDVHSKKDFANYLKSIIMNEVEEKAKIMAQEFLGSNQ